MSDATVELNELFAIPPVGELPPDVLGELQSILRLHTTSAQELFYKWESYTIKMGPEQTRLDYNTARAFKKDLQEVLERESRGKAHVRSVDKRGAYATPRGASKGDDVFGMYGSPVVRSRKDADQARIDGMIPNTPLHHRSTNGSIKRKSNFETPPVPKFNKRDGMSSPTDVRIENSANGTV